MGIMDFIENRGKVEQKKGRNEITSTNRRNFSKRAFKGNLITEKSDKYVCRSCGNKKFFDNGKCLKCTKCKEKLIK